MINIFGILNRNQIYTKIIKILFIYNITKYINFKIY